MAALLAFAVALLLMDNEEQLALSYLVQIRDATNSTATPLPTRTHDTATARIRTILAALRDAGLSALGNIADP